MQVICHDCMKPVAPEEFLTQINPPTGYGRPAFRVCDDCMRSGRWDHWIAEHWPNWPEKKP